MSAIVLHGYGPSVYTWAARLGLCWKGVAFAFAEVNPFDPAHADEVRALHPFGRVPVLEHGGARIYETAAILDYLDAAFDGPVLTPSGPLAMARMREVQGIVDGYGYWPLVRQVYVQGVAREDGNAAELAEGIATAWSVLAALDKIAQEGLVLDGMALSLSDAHLYPMIDYFQRHAEAAEMLTDHKGLAAWYARLSERDEVRDTRPVIAP